MSISFKLKPMLAVLMLPILLLLSACEEQQEVDRDLTLTELQIISKQWCATVPIAYSAPYNTTMNTLIKLDLTATGYIHVSAVTLSPHVSPPYRQTNSLNCSITSQENMMVCYGVGEVALDLDDDGILNINLIAEANAFAECSSAELIRFR